jgi:hypothetical protein
MTTTVTMTETELQDAVVELAHLLGWRCVHFRAGRTSTGWRTACQFDAAGWPDLSLVGHGTVLFRELKSERGRLSPEQEQWRDCLLANGIDWGVWRPSDWTSGEIERVLRGTS